MILASKYVAFWIQPELFKAIASRTSGPQRKATVAAQFGFSIAYNQKLGLNYNRVFNKATNKADVNRGGFLNANYSPEATIGMLPRPTVANFKGPLEQAHEFWQSRTDIHEWITGALKRYQ